MSCYELFLGGRKKMKNYLMTFVISAALLGTAGIIQAQEPFVRISTTAESFKLGTFSFWEDGTSSSILTVKVESNCLHGPVVASITPLKRAGSVSITPDRIMVKTETTGGYVSMATPVAVSETTEGSHDIKMNFKIKTYIKDHAGRYSGTLAFTVMPPS
jgi:hypothetical protein